MQIERIKVYSERQYVEVQTRINENRTTFNMYVIVTRELGSNYLIMKTNLRLKSQKDKAYRTLFELQLGFCEFLTEYKDNFFMRYFIKKSMQLSDFVVCPIRVGNYSMLDVNVSDNVNPANLEVGQYKFFTEIVEVTGELPKVFAMQVTTKVEFPK